MSKRYTFDTTDDTGLARVYVERREDHLRLMISGHEATKRPAAVQIVLGAQTARELGDLLVSLAESLG